MDANAMAAIAAMTPEQAVAELERVERNFFVLDDQVYSEDDQKQRWERGTKLAEIALQCPFDIGYLPCRLLLMKMFTAAEQSILFSPDEMTPRKVEQPQINVQPVQDFPADAREVPSAGKRAPSKWNLPVGGWFLQGTGLTAQAMRSLHHKCRKTGELKGGVYKVFQTEGGDVYVRREA